MSLLTSPCHPGDQRPSESITSSATAEVGGLLDTVRARGFAPGVCVADKGYDAEKMYTLCEDRDIRPVVPLRQTGAVVKGEHRPPECSHGEGVSAGSDYKRGAAKYRCPAGECAPGSTWLTASRLHTLVPRGTDRWKTLYESRTAVERAFARAKTEWALLPLRVRRLERVRLHVGLTLLTQLASALADSRAAVPLVA